MRHRPTLAKRAAPSLVGEHSWRLYAIVAVLGAFTVLVVGKLFYMQIIQHGHYRALADEEHWRENAITAPRGAILAADGRPLSLSVDFETLYADGKHLSDPVKAASRLAPVLGENDKTIAAKISAGGDTPVLLRRHMATDQANQVRGLRLLNVYFEKEPLRLHPEGALASQLVGFVGADHEGLLGLEMAWDEKLAGKPGKLWAEVDTAGSEIALGVREYEAPVRGADILTTIDRYAQRVVERELDAAMKRHSADAGTIVVMEPSTGAILAMASRPSFAVNDPDLFEPGKESLYKFQAVSDFYEPGSIFKVITMASGLDAGAVTAEDAFYDNGYVTEGGVTVSNWDGQGHGWQSMAQILQRSLNTGSSYVAKKLGPARFYDYLRAFGFGRPTNVDLPGEASGLVRDQKSDGWSATDLLTNSFGQGIGVSAVQMVRAVAAIANEGRLMKPQVVREVRSAEGTEIIKPQVERQVISPQTARTVTNMMVFAVEESVVGLAKADGYRVAGKSGTAETLVDGQYSKQDTIASFVGFGPAEDPRFAILVSIVRPKDNIWGEAVAAPIFSTVMRDLLMHDGVPPEAVAQR